MSDLVTTAPSEAPNASVPTTDSALGLTAESLTPAQLAYRRFKQHKAAVVSVFVLAVMILFVVLSPLTARYGVNQAIFKSTAERPNTFLSPRGEAWFGTDDIGRDLYSRLIYGLKVSMLIGLASAVLATLLGIAIGSYAAVRGGWFDDLMMRLTDLFLSFPFLVALLVTRQAIGAIPWLEPIVGNLSSIRFVIFLFVLFGWMGVARLVRGQILALKEREFVEASRALGAGQFRIITRHLIPNSIGPILVSATNGVAGAIIGESTLSFFGYGPQPGAGQTSLGLLVKEAKEKIQSGFWWIAVFPCAALVILTLCINFLGDGLRDATDPKLASGGN